MFLREVLLHYMRSDSLISKLEAMIVVFILTILPIALSYQKYEYDMNNYYSVYVWMSLLIGLWFHMFSFALFAQANYIFMRRKN